MVKRIFILGIALACSMLNVKAQDSSHLRISLLTCTPGDELYSLFGHSAFRIVDSARGSDIVYNYGTFDFDDPNFYFKFARGKLLYYVSAEYFQDFKYIYQHTQRGITEQVLNLSQEEKQSLQAALHENLKEENKYYKYDFFFDNCTTRLRDFIVAYKHPSPILPASMPPKTTFREAIHQYLDRGKQRWSKWGIDVLLGSPTDRVMTSSEQQFLPDNLMMALEKADMNVVRETSQLYPFEEPQRTGLFFSPMVCFFLLLALFLVLQFLSKPGIQTFLIRLDGLVFFLVGLLGCVLVFMWTGTDHIMTKDNYNLIWALPTHVVAAFFVNSRNRWARYYFLATAILMVTLLVVWFFLPQELSPALIPLVFLLLFRSSLKFPINP